MKYQPHDKVDVRSWSGDPWEPATILNYWSWSRKYEVELENGGKPQGYGATFMVETRNIRPRWEAEANAT